MSKFRTGETPLDLAPIEARADQATPGPWKVWAMSVLADPVGNSNLDDGIRIANTFFTIDGHPRTNDADFIAAARTDVPALLAEVERLTRIVNGYDRTPAEQRSAEAEAEVDSLRAGNGQLRGDLERLRAENENLRGGHEVYYPLAMRALAAEAENAGLRGAEVIAKAAGVELQPWQRDTLARLIESNPSTGYNVTPDMIWWDETQEWAVPANALGVAKTGPVAANRAAQVAADPARARDALYAAWLASTGPADDAPQVPLLDEWGRRHEDDARPIGPPFAMPDATVTIEPDVSGFEAQS